MWGVKLIIAGSRTVSPSVIEINSTVSAFLRSDAVMTRLLHQNGITEVVSGAARGADAAGEAWAKYSRVNLRLFPADWSTHGKAAGKLRNREMADYADAALVFWDGMSSGAADMVTRMVARGKPVRVVPMKAGKR